jgi:hypothetical protein
MARSGSTPWLILAAVLCTLFAIFMESAFLAPTTDALMGTEVWATEYNQYSAEGKRMVGQFVAHLLTAIAFGIWVGVIIDARRAA